MTSDSLLVLQNVDRRERRGVMSALDASQCLVWYDANGRIVDGNPNLQSLLGYDLEGLKRCTHAILTREDNPDNPKYLTHWSRIRDGELRNEERSYYTKNGSEVWSSVSYAAIKNDAGQTRRVLAIIIDLSPWSWRPNEHN